MSSAGASIVRFQVGHGWFLECPANNSFKPDLLRYTNNMAGKACHVVASATQVGLTQALGPHGGSTVFGWEVLVYRPTSPDIFIARWTTNASGLKWLDRLVKDDKAIDLGGNGYPIKYAISAGVLLPIIKAGLPANDSPLVIGEDYALPAGWSGGIDWNKEAVMACQGSDQLMIEAWDQS